MDPLLVVEDLRAESNGESFPLSTADAEYARSQVHEINF